MLTLERAATRAKSQQDKSFQHDRKELLSAEKRAVDAVRALVGKQKDLERQLNSLALDEKPLISIKKNAPQTPKGIQRKPAKKKPKKEPKITINHTNKAPILIPRPPALQTNCRVIYTEEEQISEVPTSHAEQRTLSPFEHRYVNNMMTTTLRDQEYRKQMLLFLGNLDLEEYVTIKFLDAPYSEEDAHLPENWRDTSIQFGLRLKNKIGELVNLYNEYFEKMEAIGAQSDNARENH